MSIVMSDVFFWNVVTFECVVPSEAALEAKYDWNGPLFIWREGQVDCCCHSRLSDMLHYSKNKACLAPFSCRHHNHIWPSFLKNCWQAETEYSKKGIILYFSKHMHLLHFYKWLLITTFKRVAKQAIKSWAKKKIEHCPTKLVLYGHLFIAWWVWKTIIIDSSFSN